MSSGPQLPRREGSDPRCWHLVLGFPGLVARRVVETLLGRGERVVVLTANGVDAASLLGLTAEGTGLQGTARLEVLRGQAEFIDFGLSGDEYQGLAERVRYVVCAVEPDLEVRSLEEARPLRAASELVEFCRVAARIEGVTFLSSLLVFGAREGTMFEYELAVGQRFAHPVEESVAVAEKNVRRLRGVVPLAIVRTAPVSGDVRGGEVVGDSLLALLGRRVQLAGPRLAPPPTAHRVCLSEAGDVARALVAVLGHDGPEALHFVDADPPTAVELLARLALHHGRALDDARGSVRHRPLVDASERPGARLVTGARITVDTEVGRTVFGALRPTPTMQWIDAVLGAPVRPPLERE